MAGTSRVQTFAAFIENTRGYACVKLRSFSKWRAKARTLCSGAFRNRRRLVLGSLPKAPGFKARAGKKPTVIKRFGGELVGALDEDCRKFKSEDFYPYGHGQLTQVGKKSMYNLGVTLREEYKEYLDDIYIPHKVDARATETDRTQMSLQLVLAGLFPPKGDQVLKDNLNWQPIPYKCPPGDDDKMLGGPSRPGFLKIYLENYKKTPMEEYEDFFSYFEEHTGFYNATPRHVWVTLGVLSTEIFRHGDRTPIKEHMYPKSEHFNEDFYPYGHGQLTQVGKESMYNLGVTLRARYKEYLDDIYIPHKVDARATETDRTQMSLQLVLAGLFPPKGDQVLKDNLNWQPIPYKCPPGDDDKMLGGPSRPGFLKIYLENYKKTPMEEYEEFFSYFEKHTGFYNATPRHVWVTLGVLSTEREWGLDTPSWVLPVYEKIKEVSLLEYKLQTATKELKQLVAGELFSKILKDTKAKIHGESTCQVHLYSGHDHNVAHVLTILGLMYPHFPRYAACVLLEVHKLQSDHHFKVVYRDTNKSEFKLMTFPNGESSLSLREFERIAARFAQMFTKKTVGNKF